MSGEENLFQSLVYRFFAEGLNCVDQEETGRTSIPIRCIIERSLTTANTTTTNNNNINNKTGANRDSNNEKVGGGRGFSGPGNGLRSPPNGSGRCPSSTSGHSSREPSPNNNTNNSNTNNSRNNNLINCSSPDGHPLPGGLNSSHSPGCSTTASGTISTTTSSSTSTSTNLTTTTTATGSTITSSLSSSSSSSIGGTTTIEQDSYAIIPSGVLLTDLVRTALIRLGYSSSETIGARGFIQLKNWKQLTIDQITDSTEATVGDILGDICPAVVLRIRLNRPRSNAAQELKDKLLQILLAQSYSLLVNPGCQVDQQSVMAALVGHSARSSKEFDLTEDTAKKFDQWYLQQMIYRRVATLAAAQAHHHQQQQAAVAAVAAAALQNPSNTRGSNCHPLLGGLAAELEACHAAAAVVVPGLVGATIGSNSTTNPILDAQQCALRASPAHSESSVRAQTPQQGGSSSSGGGHHHHQHHSVSHSHPQSQSQHQQFVRTRIRTSFDPELELPKLHKWFAENQHPSRAQIQLYVKELNALESRRGRKPLDVNNVVYWFKNARAAHKRQELKFVNGGHSPPQITSNNHNSSTSVLGSSSASNLAASLSSLTGPYAHHGLHHHLSSSSSSHQYQNHHHNSHHHHHSRHHSFHGGKDGSESNEKDSQDENGHNEASGDDQDEYSGGEEEGMDDDSSQMSQTLDLSMRPIKRRKSDDGDESMTHSPSPLVSGGGHHQVIPSDLTSGGGRGSGSGSSSIGGYHQIKEEGCSTDGDEDMNDLDENDYYSSEGIDGGSYGALTTAPLNGSSAGNNSNTNPSNARYSNSVGSSSTSSNLPLPDSPEEGKRIRRSRTFIDPMTEVPRLEQWFTVNTHPTHSQIVKYTEELNGLPYRQKFPRLEPKNIQFWFKNRRAKYKRLSLPPTQVPPPPGSSALGLTSGSTSTTTGGQQQSSALLGVVVPGGGLASITSSSSKINNTNNNGNLAVPSSTTSTSTTSSPEANSSNCTSAPSSSTSPVISKE